MEFANTSTALRELRQQFSTLQLNVSLAAAALICGLSGPFGTIDSLPFFPRILYWATTIYTTYGIGLFVMSYLSARSDTASMIRVLVNCLITSVIIASYLLGINILFVADFPHHAQQRVQIFGLMFVIATVITGIVQFLVRQAREGEENTDRPNQLLQRLPIGKRGHLISLHSEDHYLRVETTLGSEMILMRLADAIALCPDTLGLQVHRSHWIALDHVADYKKSKDRWDIILKNGTHVPISRGYRAAVIEAGIVAARG